MRIVDIRETAIPINSRMSNSSFDFSEMTTSVVALITDVMRGGKPVCGFSFNSTGRYACGAQMRARFIPRLLAADPDSLLDRTGDNLDPEKILACMMQREKAGGHSERSIPIGTIEVAVWDAAAKIAQKPLHRLLAERYNGGRRAEKVFCYVGGGWYAPGQTFKDVQDEMRRHLDAGYTMVKMKVGGLPLADDVRRVSAVLEVVAPRGGRLAVDANCKFARDEGLAYAKALAPLGLAWFEEPCDPIDYALTAEIAAAYAPPLATGENLFSTADVENLVRFGGLRADRDFIQIDPPQSYGIVQFTRTMAMLERHGWRRTALFPHGGNQMSLHIAGGLGLGGAESYPGVFGAFGGFADDAVLADGYLSLPDRPGIGFEAQNALYKIMRDLAA